MEAVVTEIDGECEVHVQVDVDGIASEIPARSRLRTERGLMGAIGA